MQSVKHIKCLTNSWAILTSIMFKKKSGISFLGNEHLHQLTAQGKYNLRINMEDFNNNEKYATYKQFAVGDEKSVYKLTVGVYQGDAGMF